MTFVNDHQQFPAAQVAYVAKKGVEVFLYQQTLSSTAESMNAANKSIWARTAVDPINAMMLLLLVAHVGDMLPTHDNVGKNLPTGRCRDTNIISCLAVPAHFYVGKCQHFIDTQKY
jgi:hypothetical protein